MKTNIPKGWRRVRLGEILPQNHKWWQFDEYVYDGYDDTSSCAGQRNDETMFNEYKSIVLKDNFT